MRLLALLCNTSKRRCCAKRKKLLTCGKLLLASGFFLRRYVRMFLNKEHQTLLALSSVLFKNQPRVDSKAQPKYTASITRSEHIVTGLEACY
jgi:hypothetical protein